MKKWKIAVRMLAFVGCAVLLLYIIKGSFFGTRPQEHRRRCILAVLSRLGCNENFREKAAWLLKAFS